MLSINKFSFLDVIDYEDFKALYHNNNNLNLTPIISIMIILGIIAITILIMQVYRSKKMMKEKKKVTKNNNILIISICISVIIVIAVGLVLVFNYKQKKLELDKINQLETIRQSNITKCLDDAKVKRSNLWKSNCPENNPNCSLRHDTIEWIDERYNKEVDICLDRYK